MSQAKEIKRRIKSVTNTKQTMKAMELISAIKMKKAIAGNENFRHYSDSAEEIFSYLSRGIKANEHSLLRENKGKRALLILITSDRGLCGGLNIRMIKRALDETKKYNESSFITVGKKGRDFLKIYGYKIIAEFLAIPEKKESFKIKSIINIITKDYLDGLYDNVIIVYPHFNSTLSQTPQVIELLPFKKENDSSENSYIDNVIYEPGKQSVVSELIIRIIEIRVRQALMEALASEHSARMVAMKNANENAEELIDDLTLTLNQQRQSNITKELAEISAGKMALEG